MAPHETDPIAQLWLAALRAELDAVVLRFEAQLKQHVAASQAAHDARLRDASQKLAAAERDGQRAATQHQEAQRRLAEAEQALHRASADRDRLAREVERLRADGAAREEAHGAALVAAREEVRARDEALARLEDRLRAVDSHARSLDEQFSSERAFVAALLAAEDSGLFEAAEQVAGVEVEAAPGCYGALKTRGLEAVLTQAVRERGRSTPRVPLTAAEWSALRALADAAGCRLLEVARGERFVASRMEKVAERSEPSEEGEVLECVMPGLRRADAAGSLVFPRVVVAIG